VATVARRRVRLLRDHRRRAHELTKRRHARVVRLEKARTRAARTVARHHAALVRRQQRASAATRRRLTHATRRAGSAHNFKTGESFARLAKRNTHARRTAVPKGSFAALARKNRR
jgi:hypothetical protein